MKSCSPVCRDLLKAFATLSRLTSGIFLWQSRGWTLPLLLFVLPAAVQAQFNYTTNHDNGTITIWSIWDKTWQGELSIPRTINGWPVTTIAERAFAQSYHVTSITVPETVTNIGDGAFAECANLTSITVDTANPAYCSNDGILFNKSQTILIQWPGGKGGGSYIVPGTVTEIGEGAFRVSALTSVTLGDNLNNIRGQAFYQCSSLTNATLGNNVTNIGELAFFQCGSLPGLTIPASVASIGRGVFVQCSGLMAITVDGSNLFYTSVDGVLFNKGQSILIDYPAARPGSYTIPNGVTIIADQAFSYCIGLASVIIPDTTVSIGPFAFSACTGLTNVVIGNGLTSIEIGAFDGCSGLLTVNLPDSLISIGDFAFHQCYSLTAIVIPKRVISIGSWAFEACSGLGGGITIPAGVNEISEWAFAGCSGLTNIAIPNSVGSIGDYAFAGCSRLKGITLPNSVTNLGQNAFASCGSLTNVTIPVGVTSIANGAFQTCTNLTTVTFLGNITNIGSGAFANSTKLTGLYCQGNAPTVGADVFLNDNNATVYCLPWAIGWGSALGNRPVALWNVETQFSYTTNNGTLTVTAYTGVGGAVRVPSLVDGLWVTSIGDFAFTGCGGLNSIVIPNSVTNIGMGAFHDCSNLTEITAGNALTWLGQEAFASCSSLTRVYLQGNAPNLGNDVFLSDTNATVYYLPGTSGWGTTFGSRPTILLNLGTEFNYTTNNGAITITGYRGPTGAVSIPDKINGLPVASIGDSAFSWASDLTSLSSSNGLTYIGRAAFYSCGGLTNVTIGSGLTSIGEEAFSFCTNLSGIYFQGNAPSLGQDVFLGDNNATVYYLPGSMGWESTLGGRPTALWAFPLPLILSNGLGFGVQTNRFGFTIFWATQGAIVVEATTNLAQSSWLSVQTNMLSGGWSYFSDPDWTNYPARFYRVTSSAQSGVHSPNVVGYVSVTIHGGSAFGYWGLPMIANPLNTTNNTIGSLIPSPPDGTVLYKFVPDGFGGRFQIATYLAQAGWDHPEYTLNLGEGALVNSSTNWANTFVGEVLQGSLTNSYPFGFSIRASKVPQAGTLTGLGLGTQLLFGDTVFQFNPTNQFYESSFWAGFWSPPEPSLNVGESFWLETQAAGSWNQTFNAK